MYALNLVRRRKRRVRAAIAGFIGATGVSTLCIAAFLGHKSGSFTVSLETMNAQLTLSKKSDFKERSSFLRVDQLPEFHEYTYRNIKNLGDDVIDSEETDYNLGVSNGGKTTNFLKYTFFLKNVGNDPARFDFSLKIKEVVKSIDGRTLEDTFRVMVYDSKWDEPKVYAQRASQPTSYDENGVADYSSPISVDEGNATPEYPFEGFANVFNDNKEVMSEIGEDIMVGEVRKYTIVTWLEGFRSSNDKLAPEGATIKLGVEINAYEN
jgi:hypothetical protein